MKRYIYQLSSILIAIAFLTLAYGSDEPVPVEDEEKVSCCCCDGGQRVVYYESKKGMYGTSTGTNYDKPDYCPCCDAMKGDFDGAKLTKSRNEELKKTSNHCK